MLLSIAKRIFVLLLCGLTADAVAHRYFFSITDLALNENTQAIEVIHQITAHDIEFKHSLVGLKITNRLLIEHYEKQINTVNFYDNTIKGSLTFKRSVTINDIEINN